MVGHPQMVVIVRKSSQISLSSGLGIVRICLGVLCTSYAIYHIMKHMGLSWFVLH